MCIIHDALDAMVHFLFMQSCIDNYINVYILIKVCFYVCRKRKKWPDLKDKLIDKTLC